MWVKKEKKIETLNFNWKACFIYYAKKKKKKSKWIKIYVRVCLCEF